MFRQWTSLAIAVLALFAAEQVDAGGKQPPQGKVECIVIFYTDLNYLGNSFGFTTGPIDWKGDPQFFYLRDFTRIEVGFPADDAARSFTFECTITDAKNVDRNADLAKLIRLKLYAFPFLKSNGGEEFRYRVDGNAGGCSGSDGVTTCRSEFPALFGMDRRASAATITFNFNDWDPSLRYRPPSPPSPPKPPSPPSPPPRPRSPPLPPSPSPIAPPRPPPPGFPLPPSPMPPPPLPLPPSPMPPSPPMSPPYIAPDTPYSPYSSNGIPLPPSPSPPPYPPYSSADIPLPPSPSPPPYPSSFLVGPPPSYPPASYPPASYPPPTVVMTPTYPPDLVVEMPPPDEVVEMMPPPVEAVEMMPPPDEVVEMMPPPVEAVEMMPPPVEMMPPPVEMMPSPVEAVEMMPPPVEAVEMMPPPVEMMPSPVEAVEMMPPSDDYPDYLINPDAPSAPGDIVPAPAK